jgi:uncharacterized protein YkwD
MTLRILIAIVAAIVGVAAAVTGFVLLQPHPQSESAHPGAGWTTATPTQAPTFTPLPTATPTPTTPPAPPAPPAEEPAPPPPPPAPTCADDVLTCVNIARAENGLGPLAANATLNAAAQACADRMAASGQMTHSKQHPGGFMAWGENIAYGHQSGNAVFNGWMNSEGHRANILNPRYTQMGIGYASGNWWCQQFGSYE